MNYFNRLGIGWKIIIIIFIVVLISTIIISRFVLIQVQGLTTELGLERIEQEVTAIQIRLVEFEDELINDLRVLSTNPALIEAVAENDPNKVRSAFLTSVATSNLFDVDVFNLEGERLLSFAEAMGAEIDNDAENEIAQLVLLGIEITDIVLDDDSEIDDENSEAEHSPGSLLLVYGIPLRDRTGAIIGGLTGGVLLDEEFLEFLTLSEDDFLVELIYENRVIADNSRLHSHEVDMNMASMDGSIVNQVLGNETIIQDEIVMLEGIPHAEAFIPLRFGNGETKGILHTRIELGRLETFRNALLQQIFVLQLLSRVIVLIALFVVFRRYVFTPLKNLGYVAESLSRGAYQQRSTIESQDQIGRLAQTFNQMAAAVQKRDIELRSTNESLEERIAERTRQLEIAVIDAQEANRLKDEFLSTMSHELRTPLNAIIGFSGIMALMSELDEEDEIRVERIQANAERLLDLINDILDLSRIEAGRMQLVPTDLNTEELLDDLTSQMSILAEEKELEFEVIVGLNVPQIIQFDEDAITKIITNLLGNAFKFTKEGKVTLRLEKSARNELVIQVQDTGIGIPSHMQEIIFERFRQVDGSSKRVYGGSGLGLSIVQQLVAIMSGIITLSSEPDKGSIFTVQLPLQEKYKSQLEKA